MDIYSDSNIVVRPLDKRDETMMVELTGKEISIVVHRHHDTIGHYLGIYLSQTTGLDINTEGIIGMYSI